MKKDYTAKEYDDYISKKAPKSTIWKDTAIAFVVGGLICVIGQLIMEYMKSRGVDEDTASKALSVIMIGIGGFLTGLGWYSKIGKYAGAGSIVPITGFANSIVAPAMEFKSEGLVLGLAAKMFVVAGPVIVYGTMVSIIIGICYYFFA